MGWWRAFKLITHHWGGNWMKGFDIYTEIDDMLSDPKWRDLITFTYLGNLPKKFKFKNVLHLPRSEWLENRSHVKGTSCLCT